MSKDECKTCGRPDEGHWIGCAESMMLGITSEDISVLLSADPVYCAHGDCENPPRPPGKGPRPKYCEDHSDPKNRK